MSHVTLGCQPDRYFRCQLHLWGCEDLVGALSRAPIPTASEPLPLIAMQMQAIFQSAFMPLFRIGDYMGNLPLGRRDIIGPEHPTTIPP